jgi:hypothetical protein
MPPPAEFSRRTYLCLAVLLPGAAVLLYWFSVPHRDLDWLFALAGVLWVILWAGEWSRRK